MVILCTLDPDADEQNWVLVKPEDVPEGLLESDAMGNLVEGLLAQPPGSALWYRAESLVNYERTLQRTLIANRRIADGGS